MNIRSLTSVEDISYLTEQLKKETDPYLIAQLEQQIELMKEAEAISTIK